MPRAEFDGQVSGRWRTAKGRGTAIGSRIRIGRCPAIDAESNRFAYGDALTHRDRLAQPGRFTCPRSVAYRGRFTCPGQFTRTARFTCPGRSARRDRAAYCDQPRI
ncbi:hypothetical protein CXR04_23600 [Streptomyces sp. CMB-StM0423]|nr:hypothetical protein CXR04_23600 [Streptomyces sp. CMB-StM0423]